MWMDIDELRALVDPYRDVIWWCVDPPLCEDEVQAALDQGLLERQPMVVRPLDETPEQTRARHARRVAYFVVHGWTGPLMLDGLRLTDGHHRLAAAILRGQDMVEVVVTALPSEQCPDSSSRAQGP